jgi:membrane protease YdiL (CAAX protease family)
MKLLFPKNIYQTFLLLFIGVCFGVPLILVFHFNNMLEKYTDFIGLCIILIMLIIPIIINYTRGYHFSPKLKMPYNLKLIGLLVVMIMLFQVGLNMFLTRGVNTILGHSISEVKSSYSFVKYLLVLLFVPVLEELLFRETILKGFLSNYHNKKLHIISISKYDFFCNSPKNSNFATSYLTNITKLVIFNTTYNLIIYDLLIYDLLILQVVDYK